MTHRADYANSLSQLYRPPGRRAVCQDCGFGAGSNNPVTGFPAKWFHARMGPGNSYVALPVGDFPGNGPVTGTPSEWFRGGLVSGNVFAVLRGGPAGLGLRRRPRLSRPL